MLNCLIYDDEELADEGINLTKLSFANKLEDKKGKIIKVRNKASRAKTD